MRREIRIFAHRHTDNQVKSNSITEATLSTVVCGSSGSGPIDKAFKLKTYFLMEFLEFCVCVKSEMNELQPLPSV